MAAGNLPPQGTPAVNLPPPQGTPAVNLPPPQGTPAVNLPPPRRQSNPDSGGTGKGWRSRFSRRSKVESAQEGTETILSRVVPEGSLLELRAKFVDPSGDYKYDEQKADAILTKIKDDDFNVNTCIEMGGSKEQFDEILAFIKGKEIEGKKGIKGHVVGGFMKLNALRNKYPKITMGLGLSLVGLSAVMKIRGYDMGGIEELAADSDGVVDGGVGVDGSEVTDPGGEQIWGEEITPDEQEAQDIRERVADGTFTPEETADFKVALEEQAASGDESAQAAIQDIQEHMRGEAEAAARLLEQDPTADVSNIDFPDVNVELPADLSPAQESVANSTDFLQEANVEEFGEKGTLATLQTITTAREAGLDITIVGDNPFEEQDAVYYLRIGTDGLPSELTTQLPDGTNRITDYSLVNQILAQYVPASEADITMAPDVFPSPAEQQPIIPSAEGVGEAKSPEDESLQNQDPSGPEANVPVYEKLTSDFPDNGNEWGAVAAGAAGVGLTAAGADALIRQRLANKNGTPEDSEEDEAAKLDRYTKQIAEAKFEVSKDQTIGKIVESFIRSLGVKINIKGVRDLLALIEQANQGKYKIEDITEPKGIIEETTSGGSIIYKAGQEVKEVKWGDLFGSALAEALISKGIDIPKKPNTTPAPPVAPPATPPTTA